MIRSKDDIFDEDDNNIQLVKIHGIDDPAAIETEEAGYRKEEPPEKGKKKPGKPGGEKNQ